MKKTVFLITISLIGILQSYSQEYTKVPCAELPQKTSPAMAINDFAGIMNAQTKDNLEQQSRTYFDSTTIAVVVITVPDMKGYEQFDYSMSLFRCWGIGTTNNRGILLMVALKEKKISIRTGYGIESFLTDIQSDIVIEKMKPFFKKGNYDAGVNAGVQSIFEILGTMSWEDRMRDLKEKEEAEKVEKEKRNSELLNIFLAICAFLLFVLLFIFVKRFILERKKIKELKKIYESLSQEITAADQKIRAVANSYSESPKWAIEEMKQHLNVSMDGIGKAFKTLEDMRYFTKKDLRRAETIAGSVAEHIEKAFKSFKKVDQDLRQKIKRFVEEAPDRLLSAMRDVEANIETLEDLRLKGYRLDDILIDQKRYKKILKSLSILDDLDAPRKVYTEAPSIKERSNTETQLMVNLIEQTTAALVTLPELRKKALHLWAELPTISKELEESLKKAYPKSAWGDLEKRLDDLFEILEPAKLTGVLNKIEQLLGMDMQKFDEGIKKFERFSNTIKNTEIDRFRTEIHSILASQNESKENFDSSYAKTKTKLDTLLQKIKDPDVSKSTKDYVKKIIERLREVEAWSLGQKIDWVVLLSALTALQREISTRCDQTDSEINAAEKKRVMLSYRDRKNDNKNYSSPFSSYSIGGSSSNESGGSFSGFDGGSTGGGGSDGGWS